MSLLEISILEFTRNENVTWYDVDLDAIYSTSGTPPTMHSHMVATMLIRNAESLRLVTGCPQMAGNNY